MSLVIRIKRTTFPGEEKRSEEELRHKAYKGLLHVFKLYKIPSNELIKGLK